MVERPSNLEVMRQQCKAKNIKLEAAKTDEEAESFDQFYPTATDIVHRGIYKQTFLHLAPLLFFYTTPKVKFYYHTVSILLLHYYFLMHELHSLVLKEPQSIMIFRSIAVAFLSLLSLLCGTYYIIIYIMLMLTYSYIGY